VAAAAAALVLPLRCAGMPSSLPVKLTLRFLSLSDLRRSPSGPRAIFLRFFSLKLSGMSAFESW